MKEQKIRVYVPSIQMVKTYRYDELPEESKGSIRDEWRDGDDYDWSEEIASMKAIAKALNCDLRYEQDPWGWTVRLSPNFEYIDEEKISGVRALAYIENKFITPNEQGKYRSNGWCDERYRYYRSKCQMVFSCPFTGYYLDDDMWIAYEQWRNDLRKNPKNPNMTVEMFLAYVEDVLAKDLDAVVEDHKSDEYVDEEIEANWDDRWYTIDGRDVTDDIA